MPLRFDPLPVGIRFARHADPRLRNPQNETEWLNQAVCEAAERIARQVYASISRNPMAFAKMIRGPGIPEPTEIDALRCVQEWEVSVVVVTNEHLRGMSEQTNIYRLHVTKLEGDVRELRRQLQESTETVAKLQKKLKKKRRA